MIMMHKIGISNRKALIGIVIKLIGAALGYLITILISRSFGPEGQGIFSFFITLTILLSTINQMGLSQSILKYTAQIDSYHSYLPVLKKMLLYFTFSTIIIVFVLFAFTDFFEDKLGFLPMPNWPLLVSFSMISFSITKFMSDAINGAGDTKLAFLVSDLFKKVFFLPLLIAGILILPNNIYIYVYYSIGLGIAAVVAAFLFYFKVIKKKKKTSQINIQNHSVPRHTEVLSLSLNLFVTSSTFIILNWADRFMINYYLETSQLGLYSVAGDIATINSFISAAVTAALAGTIVKRIKDTSFVAKEVHKVWKLLLLGSLAFSIPALIFAQPILNVFGSEFVAADSVFAILVIASMVGTVFGPVGVLLQYSGNEKIFRNTILFSAILNIGLNIILIPQMGIMGAAIATLIATIARNAIPFFIVKQKLGFYTVPKLY